MKRGGYVATENINPTTSSSQHQAPRNKNDDATEVLSSDELIANVCTIDVVVCALRSLCAARNDEL